MNKKDLPATKEDISGVKADIAGMKGDIARLDVKIDERFGTLDTKIAAVDNRLDAKIDAMGVRLDAKIDSTSKTLALEIIRLQTGLQEVRETMSTKDDIERILRHIDGFAAQAIHYARADATRGQALIKVEVMADDHERRILALESARPRPQAP